MAISSVAPKIMNPLEATARRARAAWRRDLVSAKAPGSFYLEENGVMVVSLGINTPQWNLIIDYEGASTLEKMQEYIALFAKRGCHSYSTGVLVTAPRFAEFDEMCLKELGLFSPPSLGPIMSRSLTEDLPPKISLDGVEIRRLTGPEGAQIFLETMIASFDQPKDSIHILENYKRGLENPHSITKSYAAFIDNKPVALGCWAWVDGTVAGLYQIGTIPTARKKGLGSAITLRLLEDAKSSGCKLAVLEATAMGLPVYEKLGFKVTANVKVYIKK